MIFSPLSNPLRTVLSSAFAVRRRGGVAPPSFDPATLFGVSDRGGIYDMTSSANLFQLSGGTGSVAVGDPVGYVADLGPIVRPALQATSTSRPVFVGWPKTLGPSIVTNGRFAADTDWSKGAGWSISDGRASKAAGTASQLSQPLTFAAGKFYFVQFQITRTAGTVLARLTGGIAVSGVSRNINGGYYDLLLAATGNTTFEFSADATFAGQVFNLVVREVLTFVDTGLMFDGVDDRIRTAAIDLSNSNQATMVLSFRSSQVAANKIIAQFGGTGQVRTFTSELVSGRHAQLSDGTNTSTSVATENVARSFDGVLTVTANSSGATINDQISLRSMGYTTAKTNGGTLVTAGPMAANGVLSLGSPFNNNTWFGGTLRRAVLINRALSESELASLESWASSGMCIAGVLGDSTVAINTSANPLPNSYSVSSLVGGLITGGADVSKVGDRISDQLAAWSAVSGKSALQCVILQIGLNDIKGRIGENTATSSDVISELQSAVNTVRASISPFCKIYISGLNPCKGWLDSSTNAAAAYAGWLAVNEAISGNGSTPITGVDGRITTHVSSLNDGSGYLQSVYQTDSADFVHENSEARFIISQAWRTQLEAGGLL
jgi:hypothetical protein